MMPVTVSEISRLAQARQLLETIKSPKKTAAIARQVERLLAEEEADRNQPLKYAPSARKGGAKIVYKVERTGLGENVAEYRPGSKAKPFRCPKPLYEAMIAIFAEARSSLTVREIVDEIEKLTGLKPGDHQYRPAIRIWMNVDPPLLSRNRSRYGAADREMFADAAHKLWQHLANME